MTAAMESLSRVKMPFPPIPKLDQFPSHYRGGGDNGHGQEPQLVGQGGGGGGPGSLPPPYVGVPPSRTTHQYQYAML